MPRRDDIHKIMLIGSGPIVIGQACEFDYSGTQACKALREEGYEVVLVNSNPATIMTDPDLADATYVEPITAEWVERVIEKERPDALLPTMGGQTGLNTAMDLYERGLIGVPGTVGFVSKWVLVSAAIEAPPDELARLRDNETGDGMVAEHDNRIIGFMIYELHKTRLHILNFSVHDDFRRSGVDVDGGGAGAGSGGLPPSPRGGGHIDGAAALRDDAEHHGKPQSRAAMFTAPGFVYTVKSLE